MQDKNLALEKKIQNICFFIYHSSKIDVQFVNKKDECSMQLYHTNMPVCVKQSIRKAAGYIFEVMKSEVPTKYFYYTDNFQLNYLGVGLWEKEQYEGAFIIGPFLAKVPNDILIQDIANYNYLSHLHQTEIRQYYNTIPMLPMNVTKRIGYFVVNMAMANLHDVEGVYSQEKRIAYQKSWQKVSREEYCYSEIEARFEIEQKIMKEVKRGNEKKALELFDAFFFDASYRMPENLLRVSKNLGVTYNTMLRIAAREGGVHPIHLHQISDKFAILIEKTNSMKELEKLQRIMTIEYCELVKDKATAGYSILVKQAVDCIQLTFDKEISLQKIADMINVTSSHLSKKFKKETGMTITQFINQRRVKEAKLLLEKTKDSITDIAVTVGFEDPSYFSYVFRKLEGMTPREYAQKFGYKEKK